MDAKQSEFLAEVERYYKRAGYAGFMVKSKPDPHEVQHHRRVKADWFDYLKSRGLTGTLRFWKYLYDGGSKIGLQVPSENPEHFDLKYSRPVIPGNWDEAKPGPRSGRIVRDIQDTLRTLRMAVPRGQKQRPEDAYANRAPAPVMDMAAPLSLSPDALKTIGV